MPLQSLLRHWGEELLYLVREDYLCHDRDVLSLLPLDVTTALQTHRAAVVNVPLLEQLNFTLLAGHDHMATF